MAQAGTAGGGGIVGFVATLGLIYHSVVREIRKEHRHALTGLVMNIVQTVLLIATFYLMFSILGLRGSGLRGDFLLYIMSGIFMYFTHTKAMGAVIKAEGPTSPMMQHAPLSTLITISAAAVAALYIQMLSLVVVLFVFTWPSSPSRSTGPRGRWECCCSHGSRAAASG